MSGKAPKIKGNRYERELVKQARSVGLLAERAYASNGNSLGEAEAVDLLVAGMRVQAKRRRKIASYLQVPDGADATAFRCDHGVTYVLLRWSDYLRMLGGDLNGA